MISMIELALLVADGELGVHRLGESFLSMDTNGRVVRLDSFAKMLAPGMRVGWLTAHPDLTARFCFAHHGSCLGANSVMQVWHYEICKYYQSTSKAVYSTASSGSPGNTLLSS